MTRQQAGNGDMAHWICGRLKPVATSLLCLALLWLPAGAAAPAPIKLAMFDFELDDVSAGASADGEASSDVEQLARASHEVGDLLARSGRYELIDVSGADAAAAKAHTLRDCGGCEATLALKLGADQSLLGVVRRISRLEYVVRVQIRDARTGAVLSDADSGLRMGANYSWDRGAARLVQDRLLNDRAQP